MPELSASGSENSTGINNRLATSMSSSATYGLRVCSKIGVMSSEGSTGVGSTLVFGVALPSGDCGGNCGDLSGVRGCGTGRLTVAYKGDDFLPSSARQSALSLPSVST